jgi:maleamate amidohydrolase
VGADICIEVMRKPGEWIIRKTWPNAFEGTGLKERLAAESMNQLIVVGVWTDACVRASVFGAIYAGLRVWLVNDACGSGTQTMHRTAVLDMAPDSMAAAC